MVQSLSFVPVHLVFSTKNRKPFIIPELENRLYSNLSTIASDLKCDPFEINGMPDHVHLLLLLSRTITQSDLAEKLKSNSSRWFKTIDPRVSDFSWQGGFGIFGVDSSSFDRHRQYIVDQKKHHESQEFKSEYTKMLNRYKIKYDEKFLWD